MKRIIRKRLIPFLLTFLLVLSLIPVSAFAEDEQIITEDTHPDPASYETQGEADPGFGVGDEPDTDEIIIEEYADYACAAVGGAVGGAVLAGTGNIGAANFVTGFVTTGCNLSVDKTIRHNSDKSWGDIAIGR